MSYKITLFKVFCSLGARGVFKWLPDDLYLKVMYRLAIGRKLNLDNPTTFTEKLQWLKLNDRNPEYTKMVDKYEVKEYVSKIIGNDYIIPTLGVWEKFEDIDFGKLPDSFVLKCTHDSGGLIICNDKNNFNIKKARNKINKSLKRNYFWTGREWPYKNVKPRIIAEKYMEDSKNHALNDYKFFAFNGSPKILFIATERQDNSTETKFDFFDMNYKHLDFRNAHPNADVLPEKPQKFDEMKELVNILSKGIPCVRVDFYEVDGKVYFGEMTFYHNSGLVPFEPQKWDATIGSWISLNKG